MKVAALGELKASSPSREALLTPEEGGNLGPAVPSIVSAAVHVSASLRSEGKRGFFSFFFFFKKDDFVVFSDIHAQV